MKIALGVQYNGYPYYGWQAQSHTQKTIEHELTHAISMIANSPIKLYCAGRTDSSVHATGQVVHFETDVYRENHAWLLGINSKLSDHISISWVLPVDDSFHARFSAKSRKYRYIIYNNKVLPAVWSKKITHYWHLLDSDKMHQAAQCLVGEHDFSSFRAAHCQSNTPFRFIDFIAVVRKKNYIVIDISANAFLYHMVRNIVGSLIEVGRGTQSIDWFYDVFQAKNRKFAAATAPPFGLYLIEVIYDNCYNIPITNFPLFIGE